MKAENFTSIKHSSEKQQWLPVYDKQGSIENNVNSFKHADSPFVLDVLVNTAGYHHGNQCVVPGRDEHEGETQTHPQEGEGPGGHAGRI